MAIGGALDRQGASPRRLLLIADDLTGALDTAAQFVAVASPINASWRATAPAGSVAIDTGAREESGEEAEARVTTRLARTPFDPATIHFAKLDTLLRGHPAHEIAAWLRWGAFEQCIIAPAFPYHGRITRDGRQYRLTGGGWTPAATDLQVALEARGLDVSLRRPGERAPQGISLWDAETDADLDAIAVAGLAARKPTLWCGAGGLAAALARRLGKSPTRAVTAFALPALGLFGSDQITTAQQVDACGGIALSIRDGGASAAEVSDRLTRDGVALVRVILPEGAQRSAAAETISREFGRLVRAIPPPATLLVAGGETLRGICASQEADHLELVGQIEPGVPCSILRGGRLDGVRVVSKSGAFGDRHLLRRLLALDTQPAAGVSA